MKEEKKIIVTEASVISVHYPTERYFDATHWEDDSTGRLHVFDRKAVRIATYAPGAWISARFDDEPVTDDGEHADCAYAEDVVKLTDLLDASTRAHHATGMPSEQAVANRHRRDAGLGELEAGA